MNSIYKKELLFIEDKLIKQIAKYDSTAFETVYQKASGAVFGLAMALLANVSDAEDVVQETFISIYNNANSYKEKGKAMAWIFTIARNHSLMKLRDRKKNAHVDFDHAYDVGSDENIEEKVHKEQLIDVLLRILNEEERQIVVMHSMSNMKHKEIAKILDLPLSTVLSKYKRSLEKLRNEMEVSGYEK